MDCKCKHILNLQPKCDPVVNVDPKCNPTVNIQENGKGTLYHDKLVHRDLPDQHPISAITGLQDALDTYIHEQGEASSEWTINHNLNKFPSVTVVDSAGSEIIVGVRYVDSNTCVIDLTSPFKGKAYLN